MKNLTFPFDTAPTEIITEDEDGDTFDAGDNKSNVDSKKDSVGSKAGGEFAAKCEAFFENSVQYNSNNSNEV